MLTGRVALCHIQYYICHIILFLNTNEANLKNSEICELSCCDLRNTVNLHHIITRQFCALQKWKRVTTDYKSQLKLCIYMHSRGSLIKLIFYKWQANTILWKTDFHKNSQRKPDSNQVPCVSSELSFAQETGWSAVMEEYPTRINCS